jgi:SAM-dependent methyltransferase
MDSTQRFSSRVEDYVRYRPTYPSELIAFLHDAIGLTPQSQVADVGSGTGISAELFLRHGCTVYAVEPNGPMRAAAERLLGSYPGFHSVNGTSVATGLAETSVDIVTAFQAFHWFDVAASRKEFARVLRPGGWTVLVWNDRRLSGAPFLEAYENLLLGLGTDYQRVRHNNVTDAVLAEFFGPGGFERHEIHNEQRFDFDGLRGRLLSSSYAPAAGQPGHEPMLHRLREIFDQFNEAGIVRMTYDTRIYYGRLA